MARGSDDERVGTAGLARGRAGPGSRASTRDGTATTTTPRRRRAPGEQRAAGQPGPAGAGRPGAARRLPANQATIALLGGREPPLRALVQRQPGNTATTGLLGGPASGASTSERALVAFATGSAELTAAHRAVVAQVAAELNAQPLAFGGQVTIAGWTDRRGGVALNRRLAGRRAEAVRRALVSMLTDQATARSVHTVPVGEPDEGPVVSDPALRRVTIRVTRRDSGLTLVPDLTLGGPSPGDPLPPELLPRRLPSPHPQLPSWFWEELPATPPAPDALRVLAEKITSVVGREGVAWAAGLVVNELDLPEARVRQAMDEALDSGGEAAARAVLRAMVETLMRMVAPPPVPTGPTRPVEPPTISEPGDYVPLPTVRIRF